MKTKIKINNKEAVKMFLIFLLIFPFVQQRTYSEMPAFFGMFYRVTTILASSVMLFISFINIRLIRKNKNIKYFVAFWAIYMISTILNSPQDIWYVLYNAISLLSLVLYVSIECRKNVNRLLHVLTIIYGAYIYLNFVFGIIFPGGLYETQSYHSAYLLGDDNAMIYVILPGIICMMCYSLQRYKKIKWYVWGAAILSDLLLIRLWSASAMVVLTLFILLTLYTLHVGRINPKILLIGAFGAIVMVLWGLNNLLVQKFITDVLHKDITLSNRTFFWGMAMMDILKKPILGYGGYFQYGRWKMSVYSSIAYPCHTPYFQLVLDAGVLALAVFVYITVRAFLKISKKKKVVSAYILAIGMMCMLINYITEYAGLYHYFIIITLMLNIDRFEVVKSGERTDEKEKMLWERLEKQNEIG